MVSGTGVVGFPDCHRTVPLSCVAGRVAGGGGRADQERAGNVRAGRQDQLLPGYRSGQTARPYSGRVDASRSPELVPHSLERRADDVLRRPDGPEPDPDCESGTRQRQERSLELEDDDSR